MQIIQKKLSDIVPYANNTKKHDETQIKNVAESIKKYGWVQPLVIDDDGTIVIGHCRALAAERLGIEEVPCVVVSDLTEEEINALRIVDNKTNESPWDFDLLSAELPEIDLSDFEFDFGIEDEEEETEIVEDEAPKVDEDAEPISKLGDIWKLGRHRLMCGNSLAQADIDNLLGGAKCELTFTDPPYQLETQGGGILKKANKGLPKETYSKCYIGKKDNDNELSYSKPVELCAKYIQLYGKNNILDLFGGSGSTLIACEQLGRTCYMMELDPKYCDVILQRYINLKGTSEDVYRLNADGTKTKYTDLT